jgi:hypothetical protein
MKRIALLGAIVLLAIPVTAAFAGSKGTHAGRASSAAPPRSQLDEFACHKSPVLDNRSISIRAIMRPVASTQKMEMRFELLSKSAPGAAPVEILGNGLDTWITPKNSTLGQRPGDVWIVPDEIHDLPAAFYYHYRVSFRWTGAGGRVLATKTRASHVCSQPVALPDLTVSSIAVQPIAGKPMKDQYVASIENIGHAPAVGPISVTFSHSPASATTGTTPVTTTGTTPPTLVTVTKTIPRVAVGVPNEVTVTFTGPACSAATAPTLVVNPGHTVIESNYDDNSLTVDPSCPAQTLAPTLAAP